jgi:nitric oxide reductase NorE protein
MTEAEQENWGALSSLPGNAIMWVLIISELLVFGGVFLAFAGARFFNPTVFHAGQQALDIRLGGLNTIILVTSGWLAARATHAQTRGDGRKARLHLLGAGLLGVSFLVVKGYEWSGEMALGHGLESDAFFTLFYLTTGFHAAHVIMGLVVLGIVGWRNSVENLETGTAFWHMVDLIWLMVFPVFYLTR